MSITFIKGDATRPEGEGAKIIAHVCNDIGGWGRGFVVAISKRWTTPEASYRNWHLSGPAGGFMLGAVQFVQVEPDIWLANMVGQHGIARDRSGPPIRYDAIARCLQLVAVKAAELNASVHMPRIGCGLAGGNWEEIEPIIDTCLIGVGIEVTVYDFV